MDIFDIITEPPVVVSEFIFDVTTISLIIIAITLFIILLAAVYSRRFISIYSLNLISVLLKNNSISYKDFAYMVAKILCYRHKTTRISKQFSPFKESKKKHYLWIALVDSLNDIRYGRELTSNQSDSKLHKTALEWLRQS